MSDKREVTGAEGGLTMERQIQIALEAMAAHGGTATTPQIYEAVTRHLLEGLVLSPPGEASLRNFVNQKAVEKGWAENAQPGWRITPQGRAYLEEVAHEIGTETEDSLGDETRAISTNAEENSAPPIASNPVFKPFDPTSIRVDQRMMSIFEVMRRIRMQDIEIQPDFQRNFVWNSVRQSRLIESILLRIPLPAFYLDATLDDKWLVVDGLQRFTTLNQFINKTDLPLTNLEFFTELEGKRFHELPRNLQRQIEDTELNLYVIRPETPPDVKFTVFSRVNTGGLVLTAQEIRHALFQGRATSFLAELGQLEEFIRATSGSINPLRMEDRECALRFAAFYMTSYETYGRADLRTKSGRSLQQNLDGFLSAAMERINRADEASLAQVKEAFQRAMNHAEVVFGQYAFRKMYKREGRRTQISKPLFEVWSILLQSYALEALQRSKDAIVDGFIELMNQVEFNKSISLGTGSPGAVHTRFRTIDTLLKKVVQ